MEGCHNLARHAEVDGPVFVIPLELNATVERAVPVGFQRMVSPESVVKVFGVLMSDKLYAKVVDNEREQDRAPFLLP